MAGVKVMSRINNFGVMAELIGASVLVVLLLVNATRGPGIVLHNFGLGAGHTGVLRGLHHWRDHERLRHVPVRYRRHARRGDERAASQRPSGDHPGAVCSTTTARISRSGARGIVVNVIAVVYGMLVAINIAWPRAAVYDALAGTKDASAT
jgi:hypothetical protein